MSFFITCLLFLISAIPWDKNILVKFATSCAPGTGEDKKFDLPVSTKLSVFLSKQEHTEVLETRIFLLRLTVSMLYITNTN